MRKQKADVEAKNKKQNKTKLKNIKHENTQKTADERQLKEFIYRLSGDTRGQVKVGVAGLRTGN